MSMPWFLEMLELPPHADERAVRRAYAMRVKLIDQAADPAAFARLREAYEAARAWIADEHHHAEPPRETAEADQASEPVAPPMEDEPSVRPAPIPVSPQEQATRLFDRLAARVADGKDADIGRELDACTSELRLQYIDAPGIFEEVLIDRLARGLIARRAAVFDAAMEHFHWQEIGHVASLGPKGLWIEAVEAQRMVWNGIAPRVRTRRLALIEQAASAPFPLAPYILRRWHEVRDDFRLYPAYLNLYIGAARLREWSSGYEALPTPQRQALEARARKPRWRMPNLWSTYPVWGFLFLALVIGVGRLTASLTDDWRPDPALYVRLDPHRQGRPHGHAIISVSVTNMTTGPVYLPEARTPLFTRDGHLTSNVFDIVDEAGAKATFTGRETPPSTGDARALYNTLGPGETRQQDVDLSLDYRLVPGRQYRVSYIQRVARSVGTAGIDDAAETEEQDPSTPVDIEMPADAT
jgi:hypothetical protein